MSKADEYDTDGMGYYVFRRMVYAIPAIFGTIVLVFFIVHSAPGSPVQYLAGQSGDIEYIRMIERKFGLDRPLWEQLIIYLSNILRGDLGYSYVSMAPIVDIIAARAPPTILLMGGQYFFATIIGVILGVVASRKVYSAIDNITSVFSLCVYSIPIFFLGQLLMLTFALYLGWFPSQGMLSFRAVTGAEYVKDVFHHLFLPCLTLILFNQALITRLTRGNMLEVLREDYITTARSKGLDENRVIFHHALRNALLPVITVMGMNFGYILTGSVLVETVFGWPGLGLLMYESAQTRDYPVLMAMLMILTISVILVNIATDVVYSLVDPRIRHR